MASRIIPETPVTLIVSPSATPANASHNMPAPLLAVLVTVIVAARQLRATNSISAIIAPTTVMSSSLLIRVFMSFSVLSLVETRLLKADAGIFPPIALLRCVQSDAAGRSLLCTRRS